MADEGWALDASIRRPDWQPGHPDHVIRLDYTFMTAPAIAGGITAAERQEAQAVFVKAHAATMRRRAAGELGFFALPGDLTQARTCAGIAERAREGGVRDVVVLGIGGSGLGPIALRTALAAPGWNALDDGARRDSTGKARSTTEEAARCATQSGPAPNHRYPAPPRPVRRDRSPTGRGRGSGGPVVRRQAGRGTRVPRSSSGGERPRAPRRRIPLPTTARRRTGRRQPRPPS